jgi:hypothetical protein
VLQGVVGDETPLVATHFVMVTVMNVNDVFLRDFTPGDDVPLPTAGGGIRVLNGANLGRVTPLPPSIAGTGNAMGPDALISYGGEGGTHFSLYTVGTVHASM